MQELFEDTASRTRGRSTEPGRVKGREIDEIPLCGSCVEEVSTETAKDDHLIPMALRRIDRYDGGLSRRRWEKAMRQSDRDDRSDDTPSSPSTLSEPEHQTSSTFDTGHQRRAQHVSRTPSPIYVSMHDPIAEPAFRRSRTKPIPKWMQYLPSKKSDELDCMKRPSSVLDDYFSPHDSSVAGSDEESSIRTSPSPPAVPAHVVPIRSAIPKPNEEQPTNPEETARSERSISLPRSSHAFVSKPIQPAPAFKAFQMSRPFTFIDEKPGQRPSSRLQPGRLSPSRHVRFISPPKTSFSHTTSSGSVGQAKSPSESSEFLDCHVPQASQSRSSVLLPSSLRDANVSVATPVVSRYTGGAAGPSAKAVLRSFADTSCSPDLARGSAEFEGAGRGKYYSRCNEHAGQRKTHCGGDGAAESVGERRPGRVITFQDQLKRVFGFS